MNKGKQCTNLQYYELNGEPITNTVKTFKLQRPSLIKYLVDLLEIFLNIFKIMTLS